MNSTRPGLPAAQLLPGRRRVGPIEEHAPRDEGLVLGRASSRRPRRRPRVGYWVRTQRLLPRGLADRVAGRSKAACRRGSTRLIERRVALGRDPDPPVDRLGLEERRRRQVGELVVVGMLEEELVRPGSSSRTSGCAPRTTIALQHASTSGLRLEARGERDRLAPLDLAGNNRPAGRPSGRSRRRSANPHPSERKTTVGASSSQLIATAARLQPAGTKPTGRAA